MADMLGLSVESLVGAATPHRRRMVGSMTLFLLGFISAIALLSVALILYALRGYHRQERARQASVDAIMAKVVAGAATPDSEAARVWIRNNGKLEGARAIAEKLGKKGIH